MVRTLSSTTENVWAEFKMFAFGFRRFQKKIEGTITIRFLLLEKCMIYNIDNKLLFDFGIKVNYFNGFTGLINFDFRNEELN
jgi:hypothetical protein